MLNNEISTIKYTTNCIRDCEFAFLVRPSDPGNGNIRVVMIGISEEEEKKLDRGESLSLQRGGLSFNINPELCYAYGKFNLSPNSDDINSFHDANWFERYYVKHIVPSKYDYETHTITSDLKCGRWYDTTNIKVYLPYLYNTINKPERICIFKEYFDIFYLQKAKRNNERTKQYVKNNYNKVKDYYHKKSATKKANKLSKLTFNVGK